MEITLACDIVVATENAIFSLPEVKRGVAAINGGLTRLVRFIGKRIYCMLYDKMQFLMIHPSYVVMIVFLI